MSTTDVGRQAETVAAEFLASKGFAIIDRNWRTRWCEIDIIASKDSVILFVEVKYRSKTSFGDGLDAITPKKYHQMGFAATFWIERHLKDDQEFSLAVLSLCGEVPRVADFMLLD